MALPPFAAFRSTVTPAQPKVPPREPKFLYHPLTGAPIGMQNPAGQGADARFTPVDITEDQANNPTQAMIDDLDAVYRIDAAPYARLISDGSNLVPLGGSSGSTFPGTLQQTVVPGTPELTVGVGGFVLMWSPFTVENAGGVVIEGEMLVRTLPP